MARRERSTLFNFYVNLALVWESDLTLHDPACNNLLPPHYQAAHLLALSPTVPLRRGTPARLCCWRRERGTRLRGGLCMTRRRGQERWADEDKDSEWPRAHYKQDTREGGELRYFLNQFPSSPLRSPLALSPLALIHRHPSRFKSSSPSFPSPSAFPSSSPHPVF